MSRRGWLLFVAMGVIWGVPYLLIKVALADLTPVALVFLRTGLGALVLVPLAAARGHLRPLLAHWRAVLVFTVAEVSAPWLLLARAETRLSSSLSGLLIAAVPLVGAGLAAATGTERLGGRRLLGLLVGLVGVAALVGLDLGGGDLAALAEMAGVVVGYAVGPYVLARYLADVPGVGVTSASMGLTALGYLPVAVGQLPHHWPAPRVVASVVVLALVCTAAAFLVFVALIAEVGPVRATVVTYVNPAVAVVLGVLLLGEPFTLGIGLGFALVLAGSVIATRRPAPGDGRGPGPAERRDPDPVVAGTGASGG